MQNVLVIVTSQEEEMEFLYNENTVKESANITDRWILSCMQSLVGFFETEMAGMTLLGHLPGIRVLLYFPFQYLPVFLLNTEEVL